MSSREKNEIEKSFNSQSTIYRFQISKIKLEIQIIDAKCGVPTFGLA
jgi:hypothetical protein